jgi:hypothetical protein
MIFGYIDIKGYLEHVQGLVVGAVITDAKDRQYRQQYQWKEDGQNIIIKRGDGNGDAVSIPKLINLDESLIAFLGLYSGDGSKGSEDLKEARRIIPTISFSQKEKHLVRFAVDQFVKIFPGNIRFSFSLGEDSAYFMNGEGKEKLEKYYTDKDNIAAYTVPSFNEFQPNLNEKDELYMAEIRPDVETTNQENLAFYYHHKAAMHEILKGEKETELISVGIDILQPNITVTASLRRPFKKGARKPGGSSRSDEIHVGGLNGLGEFFLKIMHEVEDSILLDLKESSTGLIKWIDKPSNIGQQIDLFTFFAQHSYGKINGQHPVELKVVGNYLIGKWRLSSETKIKRSLTIDPLWCYIAGLYLAEGSTPKESLFKMFRSNPGSLSMGFTSSEGISIELMLRTLQKLFPAESCLEAWKVKVGSQYFPELVMTGLKNGISMLRGGNSGDGKLRSMEISLSIKEWALNVADLPLGGTQSLLRSCYADRYSHVEPTGAGVARIDFWASSTICRWYFPLLMYTVFSAFVPDPSNDFY